MADPELHVYDLAGFLADKGAGFVCPTCGTVAPGLPPEGTAPCGRSYGTVAGPNDGRTRCVCGEVHPVDPRAIARYLAEHPDVLARITTPQPDGEGGR